jgi:AraC family transcriptional regulator, positive regulator of tynA and feaB
MAYSTCTAPRGGTDLEAANETLRQVCGAYRIVCGRWWEFRGSVHTHDIGSLQLAEIGVSPCRVVRDHRDEHYRGDQFFLIFQAEGSTCMRQRGSEVTLRPGDSTLIDSRFPSVFESQEGFRQYSFHLPVALMNERFGRRPLPLAQPIHGDRGAGRLLSDLLSSLVRNASSLAGVELTGLTLQWLSTALGINDCGESVRDLERRAICAQAVAHYINSHIEEQDLTPQGIAAHFNISLRQLYRVMSSAGSTPAAMIWKHRLERARALLATSGHRVPIIEIALSCGFKDGAHFSRAYRRAFGHCPKASRSVGEGEASPHVPAAVDLQIAAAV